MVVTQSQPLQLQNPLSFDSVSSMLQSHPHRFSAHAAAADLECLEQLSVFPHGEVAFQCFERTIIKAGVPWLRETKKEHRLLIFVAHAVAHPVELFWCNGTLAPANARWRGVRARSAWCGQPGVDTLPLTTIRRLGISQPGAQ